MKASPTTNDVNGVHGMNRVKAKMGTTAANDAHLDSSNKEAFNASGWKIRNARGYEILEQPYGTCKPLRVIHIGAGASGIGFSKFVEDQLENIDLQIYEKNADVGGTWLENRCGAISLPCLALLFSSLHIIADMAPC